MNGDSKFWQFNFGHLLTLVALVCGGFVFVLKNDQRVGKLENDHVYDARHFEAIDVSLRELRPFLEKTSTNLGWLTQWLQQQQEATKRR